MDKKYGKLLTVILSIVSVGVLGLLGFLGYDLIKKINGDKRQADLIDYYDNTVSDDNTDETNTEIQNIEIPEVSNTEINNDQNTNSSGGDKKVQYQGYSMVGKIEIPKIKLKYVILDKATPSSIETSVAVAYGPGPNKIGNTVIVVHNYRNGSFFGNNDKLEIGDKIYITDNSNTRIKYNIYNIYETSPDDGDYMVRDTNGKREISLSTCTDNSKARLIIWAVEEN